MKICERGTPHFSEEGMHPFPLRILVVLPCYGGSLPMGEYCVTALQDLGHLVDVFNAPSFYGAFSALKELRIHMSRLESLESSLLEVLSQAIYAKVETFEPDLVLALAQAPITRQLLKRLRRDGVLTAMWFVEDFRIFTYWRVFAPLYDFFFTLQKSPFLDELKAAGMPNGVYLPAAALPSFHQPVELSRQEQKLFGSAVSFVGAGYPNRRMAFRHFLNQNFKIWGSDWKNAPELASCLQQDGVRISPVDTVKIFNASEINLNLHSSVRAMPPVQPGDFVNPRTFEIAACGAFQLVDRRSLLSEYFSLSGENQELETFVDMAEFEEKTAYFLDHPEERQLLAQRAREKVLARHTYHHRMTQLLETIHTRCSDWPLRRKLSTEDQSDSLDALFQELPPGMPLTQGGEELRSQWPALLQRLHLPASASLGDVVTRLRQQPGVRSPLETSLLFLDEWRRQYGKK